MAPKLSGLPRGGRATRSPSGPCPLLSMYQMTILIHMKTTLNIDDGLLAEAARLTQIAEKTALVRAGLEALIARESARRLAQLGGSEPGLRSVPRRRSKRRTAP
jgi:Arc/MetJ family transcription regulator